MSSGRSVTLNTGHQMPQLGYGTWQAGPGEVAAGVLEALRTGYRHLDLAKVYGNQAEVAIGLRRGLAEIPGLDRGQLFITSKLWNTKHRPADVEAALDDTLAELQLGYLDLYLIHWPVAFRPGDETHPTTTGNPDKIDLDRSVSVCQTWKAMIQLPKSKVRSVGVSNFSIKHLEAVIQDSGVVPAVNQIERHPRLPNTALLDYCIANKIVTTAYSAFGNNSLGLPLLVADPEIKAEAARLAVSPAQLILAWCQQGGHTVIPKSVTPDRIRENFKDVTIDDAALAAVARLGQKPQRFNLPCKYAPVWDVNVFDEDVEKSTTHQVILQL